MCICATIACMKITTWNVNGLRSLVKQGYWEEFAPHMPDILCLQEVKATPDQLPPEAGNIPGYQAFFNVPREKKGYSGVALYTKKEPLEVLYDSLPDAYNTEGRLIEAVYDDFVLFNAYFPNGGRGADRLAYKMEYYDAFLEYIEQIRENGKGVIFCGDVNTAHEAIDLARPRENEKNSGFLPEERAWLDAVVDSGYVDVWRHLHPGKTDSYTYWDTLTRARVRNVGWRIDYFFVSPDLLPRVKSCEILPQVFGSDHCPVVLDISL